MSHNPEELAENGIFTLTDENGNIRECEILLTMPTDEGEVIVFTDNAEAEDGDIKVYALILGEPLPNGDANLLPIENEETWDAVDAALAELCGED